MGFGEGSWGIFPRLWLGERVRKKEEVYEGLEWI